MVLFVHNLTFCRNWKSNLWLVDCLSLISSHRNWRRIGDDLEKKMMIFLLIIIKKIIKKKDNVRVSVRVRRTRKMTGGGTK
jgi:hypothetical protein